VRARQGQGRLDQARQRSGHAKVRLDQNISGKINSRSSQVRSGLEGQAVPDHEKVISGQVRTRSGQGQVRLEHVRSSHRQVISLPVRSRRSGSARS